MKCLIIYDSAYGNTEEVADSMAGAVGCEYMLAKDATTSDLAKADFVIIGSPTQGGRPTKAMQAFLKQIPADVLKGKPVAVFDTRFAKEKHGFGLRVVMRTVGFAAPKIANTLKSKGARLIGLPEGFIVNDTEGPLDQGELTRAAMWASGIISPVAR